MALHKSFERRDFFCAGRRKLNRFEEKTERSQLMFTEVDEPEQFHIAIDDGVAIQSRQWAWGRELAGEQSANNSLRIEIGGGKV